ncbi:hypothetical protein [Halobellus ordinarius]|uniref:hypothetical protein n=1 Tax=Halobellus ordinarius TaxID=3075120 RepID=UPI002880B0A8|nr:hypothetical protein [Halobellus sp. ZY16]
MFDPVVLLLIGVLFLQYPLAVVMYLDARRLNLKHPEQYWLGVVVPTVGVVVILYYFSARRTLPRQSEANSED